MVSLCSKQNKKDPNSTVSGEQLETASLKRPSGNSDPGPAPAASFFQPITEQNNEITARGRDGAARVSKTARAGQGRGGDGHHGPARRSPGCAIPPGCSGEPGDSPRFPRNTEKKPARLGAASGAWRWVPCLEGSGSSGESPGRGKPHSALSRGSFRAGTSPSS